MSKYHSFGHAIEHFRLLNGFSVAEVCSIAVVNQQTYLKLVTGTISHYASYVKDLAQALNTSPEQLTELPFDTDILRSDSPLPSRSMDTPVRVEKNKTVLDNPLFAKEYDVERNKEIVPLDSRKNVFWKCSVNPEHSWVDSPKRRLTVKAAKDCPECIREKQSEALNASLAAAGWSLLSTIDEGRKHVVSCGSGHEHRILAKNAGAKLVCSKCEKEKEKAQNNYILFKEALATIDYKLLDDTYKGHDEFHNVECDLGHPFLVRPRPAMKSIDKSGELKCRVCSAEGRYRKQYYSDADDVVAAMNRLGIKTNADYLAKYKQDSKLPPNLMHAFPELKGIWSTQKTQ